MPARIRRKLQIFVSSTYLDLKPERQEAVTAILENHHIPAGMELFAAGSHDQLTVIRRWINESDIFMLILGGRYGSLDPKTGKSYVHLEYDYAVSQGKPFFAIVLSDSMTDAKIRAGAPAKDVLERAELAKYQDFKSLVMQKLVGLVENTADIRNVVSRSVKTLEQDNEFVGWIPGNTSLQVEQPSPPDGQRDVGEILRGNWTGTATEDEPSDDGAPVIYDVQTSFAFNGRNISGTSRALKRGDGASPDDYTLKGEFLHDRFVRLEYYNRNRGEVNFGTEVVVLSDIGDRFEGRFVGYSSARSAIISGDIACQKQK